VTRSVALHIAVFLLYSIAVSVAAFMLPPLAGLLVATVFVAVAIHLYLLRSGAPWFEGGLRLAPLSGSTLGWTIAAAAPMLIFSWSLGEIYVRLVPVPERVLDPFGDLALDPTRWLVLAIVAIAFAPVVEEFFFRGAIQSLFTARWGAGWGIAAAAMLFSLVHVDTLPWVLPLHFALGAIFGWAVHLTGSIWAGVLLHAANNSAAFIGMSMSGGERAPTIWEQAAPAELAGSLVLLVGSAAAGIAIARRIRRERAA
jgi:uncharacterized protein